MSELKQFVILGKLKGQGNHRPFVYTTFKVNAKPELLEQEILQKFNDFERSNHHIHSLGVIKPSHKPFWIWKDKYNYFTYIDKEDWLKNYAYKFIREVEVHFD